MTTFNLRGDGALRGFTPTHVTSTPRHAVRVATAACAVALFVPQPALGKAPVALPCGSVITASTTLSADVLGCVGDGLVIGADGVTLDLAGHVVSGDAVEDPTDVGIRVYGRHSVKVVNGTVRSFSRGIVFQASPDGVVTSMTVRDSSGRGIVFVDGSDRGQVSRNLAADNGASGIAIVTSDGATVVGNRSLRNIGGAGVKLEGATHATVARNRLAGDTLGVQVDGGDHNLVVGNEMTNEEEVAVEMLFSSGNVINGNRVTRSGGITLESSDDNTITDNQVLQLAGPDGIGIQIYGNDNLVAHNTVVNSLRYGIEVDDFQDEGHSPAAGNVIRANTINGGALGIAIGPEAGGLVLNTVVDSNTVIGTEDDGIQLLGPSTGLETSVVANNLVVHNGDLGIEAIPGVIDGGGNRAAGNGNPLQCLNIACV
jgi:parallel beta-helix repeat protein